MSARAPRQEWKASLPAIGEVDPNGARRPVLVRIDPERGRKQLLVGDVGRVGQILHPDAEVDLAAEDAAPVAPEVPDPEGWNVRHREAGQDLFRAPSVVELEDEIAVAGV